MTDLLLILSAGGALWLICSAFTAFGGNEPTETKNDPQS